MPDYFSGDAVPVDFLDKPYARAKVNTFPVFHTQVLAECFYSSTCKYGLDATAPR